ncbi:MAG: hydroxymethylbilane synthase [Acidobacteriia bacterium]|nr:hydroxymethylbilane synthase [Terriglobia bacterium]
MPVAHELRLGTRGSQLALWQANTVAARIAAAGGPPCRVTIIKTSGDRLQDAPLSTVGGKRLFVKEIEDALLRRDVDLAVHSSKDMPAVLPGGLAIAGVLPREDPLDAVILPATVRLKADPTASGDVASRATHVASGFSRTATVDDLVAHLGPAPSIGTGSVRRIAQLMRLFPGARFAPIRGNLDTRLRKLDQPAAEAGKLDAIVLAAAGLRRLGFGARISMTLPAASCVPAPGQGIVAIEIREDDDVVRRAVAAIDDPQAGAALAAERALVETLGGGCQTPVGALASPLPGEMLELTAVVVALDGSRAVRAQARGSWKEAAALGARAGADLLRDGAGEILAEAQRASSTND